MTAEFARTVQAVDPTEAQADVKALAKAEGHRVRTVKSVRRVDGGLAQDEAGYYMPRYAVVLAVDEPEAAS